MAREQREREQVAAARFVPVRLTHEQREGGEPEGVHIGRGADATAAQLLERNVAHRAERVGGGRGVLAHDLGEPEVEHLDPSVFTRSLVQEQVCRLEVAMDHPVRVQRVDGDGHLREVEHDLLEGPRPEPRQPLLERLPAQQLHDQVQPLRVGVHAGVEHLDEVRRLDPPGDARLAIEALAGVRLPGQPREQQLQRAGPIGLLIDDLEDLAHPPAADRSHDAIAAADVRAGPHRRARRPLTGGTSRDRGGTA